MVAVLMVAHDHSPALDGVRWYLHEWVRWKRSWRPDIGYPHAVPYVDGMRGSRPMDGYDDPEGDDLRIHAVEMRQVDDAVTRDLTADQQHAVMVVYMLEVGPAVWHSGRKPMAEIKALCERAELALLPALRRRNLPV